MLGLKYTSSQHKQKQPMSRAIKMKFKHIAKATASLDTLMLQHISSKHKHKPPMRRGIQIQFKHIVETAESLDVLFFAVHKQPTQARAADKFMLQQISSKHKHEQPMRRGGACTLGISGW